MKHSLDGGRRGNQSEKVVAGTIERKGARWRKRKYTFAGVFSRRCIAESYCREIDLIDTAPLLMA